jgi:hypothetical protein
MRICLTVFAFSVACSPSNPMNISDMAMPLPDMAFPTAVKAPLPTVPNQGGPVLAHMKLVTVTFPSFQFETQVEEFGNWVVSSSWLTEVGAEYGVGTGTATNVILPSAAPANIDEPGIDALIAGAIKAGTLSYDDSTLFVIYFPPTTTITDNNAYNCASYKGTYTPAYHSESGSSVSFPFAVVPTCTQIKPGVLQMAAAHEVIEAATNPHVWTNPAYDFGTNDTWWQTGGEVADICNAAITVDSHQVTRVWSNRAAMTSNNPCVPTAPYYGMLPSPLTATAPAGGTVNFTVTGWSTDAIPDWQVYILPGVFGGPQLTSTLDVTTLNNGGIGHGTVTVPANARSGDVGAVLLYSSADPSVEYAWPFTVTVQ